MKYCSTLLVIVLLVMVNMQSRAQGCVAIRGNSACSGSYGNSLNLIKGEWNIQAGYRYFKSYKHFRGDHEEVHRVEEGSNVINNSHFLDISLSYALSDRLYANAIIPFVYHTRSSLYEHGGNDLGERHTTTSSGIADLRLGLGYWLFDPAQHDFNYSLAIGVKLPTGAYDYTDTFYNQGENDDQDIEAVVDQSIQPGDGGTGITLDLQGIHPISERFGILTNLYYLINWQATNGVLTRYGSSEFSCPDQFAARIGGYYSLHNGLNFFLGGRAEGVNSTDLIGSSEGYRRPGYAISVEPGLGYSKGNFSVFTSVPIALYRNRIQSYRDKIRTEQTGMFRQGDAAFADYLVNLSFSYRFGGGHGVKGGDFLEME